MEHHSDVTLPEKYTDFSNVFDKAEADKLLPYSQLDLAIETVEGKVPPFAPVYDHSKLELDVTREYITDMLAKGFIALSKSLSGASVFYIKKKDGGFCFCVDYRGLNMITVKNKHPLPLIQTLLDLLVRAYWFTKLDIIAAYHALRIRAGDE